MGQIVEFTMEREGLVKEGDRVELKEDCASTMSGQMYYYTIKWYGNKSRATDFHLYGFCGNR